MTVRCATQVGTATASLDYVAAGGTLTFAPGRTEATVGVTVISDTVVEADETFFLNLTDPTGVTPSVAKAKGMINNTA